MEALERATLALSQHGGLFRNSLCLVRGLDAVAVGISTDVSNSTFEQAVLFHAPTGGRFSIQLGTHCPVGGHPGAVAQASEFCGASGGDDCGIFVALGNSTAIRMVPAVHFVSDSMDGWEMRHLPLEQCF